MMLRKRARRSAICFALACLTFAVVSLWAPKDANTYSVFAGSQRFAINSDGWNIVAIYNFNTGVWIYSDWALGSAPVSYSLPYNANKAFYLFDWSSGLWTENIYLQDMPTVFY